MNKHNNNCHIICKSSKNKNNKKSKIPKTKNPFIKTKANNSNPSKTTQLIKCINLKIFKIKKTTKTLPNKNTP